MTEISGKAALVTGAGSGLGRAIALDLAREGASLVIADILGDSAERTASEIRDIGGSAIALQCDVSDRASVRALKLRANEACGPIQILVPNAGATSFLPMSGIADEEIDWIVQVNFMGVMNFLQIFLPDMIATGDAHILASASAAGLIPDLIIDHVPYSAAKMGVIGMMLSLRRELAGTGVQSTVFCVASVDSGMRVNNSKYRPARFGGPFEAEVVTPSSFKRMARPPEAVSPLAIQAIKHNRPMLVSDPVYRKAFRDQYLALVEQAFDDAEEFFGVASGA